MVRTSRADTKRLGYLGVWEADFGRQPRLHAPGWSDPQVRAEHLPSVLQGEVERYWVY